jgi:glucose-6-phosphate-specific signal transduction histidine kinase
LWVSSPARAAEKNPLLRLAPMLCLRAGDEVLRVLVRDDGVGGADFAGDSGLVGLKDRVEALAGRITLHSDPAGWERPV